MSGWDIKHAGTSVSKGLQWTSVKKGSEYAFH